MKTATKVIFLSVIAMGVACCGNVLADCLHVCNDYRGREFEMCMRKCKGDDNSISDKHCPAGMVYIPPGEFMMGCSPNDDKCDDNEKPAKRVQITKGFCMDKTEVTQGAYQKIIDNNPSYFQNCGSDCPVEQVTWDDAASYCQKAGKRLPTEAEWEYAARGGSETRFYGGVNQSIEGMNNAPGLDAIAWYGGNSGVNYSDGWDCSDWEEMQYSYSTCGAHPAGGKRANGFGLYDMLGNVWEWVDDCYDESWYGKMPMRDPLNKRTGCEDRVVRGHSWGGDVPGYVRVSIRNHAEPGRVAAGFGFRCAKDL